MIVEEQLNELLSAACQARDLAHAPYSNYRVGASVLTSDGRIFQGVNVENASYGLSMCAERSAIFSAVSAGASNIMAVVVCTENGVAPCGACRQVLAEFCGNIPIWLADTEGNVRQTSLYTLLPESFGPGDLLGP